MPDLQALLERIEWLDEAATNGPWEEIETDDLEIQIAHVKNLDWLTVTERVVKADDATKHDIEFIALARTALPQLAKAVRDVLDMHQKTEHQRAYGFPRADKWEHYCTEDNQSWPCDTHKAITHAMKEPIDD